MEVTGLIGNQTTHTNTLTDISKDLEKSVHNGLSIKKAEVITYSKNDNNHHQLPSTKISDRLAKNVQPDTLIMDTQDGQSKSFNEVVRRIKLDKQTFIIRQLSKVTSEQIDRIIQCCDNPSLITKDYLPVFQSEDFPYVALRAFRDGKINCNEFSTLISLHGIYKENIENSSAFKITYEALFDQNGNPNHKSWKAVEKTLEKSNKQERTIFIYDIENTVKEMQGRLKSARPLEAGYWHYDIPDASEKSTIADVIREAGSWTLSRYDDQEMLPSITMRQALVDSAFGEEAHQINPVIGVSSTDDVRLGGLGRYRDFALPFPENPLPTTADYLPAPTIADFQQHDFYHLIRVSLLKNKDIDLYIAIGDELQTQRNRYDESLTIVKSKCKKVLKSYEHIIKTTNTLLPTKKKKVLTKVENDFYKAYKLMTYLSKARKATGQLKFYLYDLEMGNSTHAQDRYKEVSTFYFHLGNILTHLNRYQGKKGRELLSGMTAELTGRIVLPMISSDCSLENTSEKHSELTKMFEGEKNTLINSGEMKNDPSDSYWWHQFERTTRFIAPMISKEMM
ncbi:hypothetical protein [Endozoicomonas sp. SCSIO W0465]|uniref:hypothetical protein n=1 Tax=Endozoicomonas sp. SCSIO W0465 TaxID=2918516 RepID=UPI002074BF5B|nr:hypothetical protein [Endozoicomonas sp. SCSIO W0465]USE34339.1 hypothetical protein MJO57_19550 [Endozoicomonas sp. SCSIO W0465]